MEERVSFRGGPWASAVPLATFLAVTVALVVAGAPAVEGMILGAMLGISLGMLLATDPAQYSERVFSLMANRVATVAVVCWLWAGAFSGILGESKLVEAIVWSAWQMGFSGSAFTVATFVASALRADLFWLGGAIHPQPKFSWVHSRDRMVVGIDVIAVGEQHRVHRHRPRRQQSRHSLCPRPKLGPLARHFEAREELGARDVTACNHPFPKVFDNHGRLFLYSFRREHISFHIDGREELELGEKLFWTEDFEKMPLGHATRVVVPLAQRALVSVQVSMPVVVDTQLQEEQDPSISTVLVRVQRESTLFGELRENVLDRRS